MRRKTRRRWQSSIPRDVYDRVLGYALDIVNASAKGDTARSAAAYRWLKRYWLSQEAKGRFHPFLPETVADFATWRRVRMRLYRYALRMAERMGEPKHTILVSMAMLHEELRQSRAAKRSLLAAHADARERGDQKSAREVAELLRAHGEAA